MAYSKLCGGVIIVLLFLLLIAPIKNASSAPLDDLLLYYRQMYVSQSPVQPLLTGGTVAKAQPDECYNGIGNPYPPGPPCNEGQPKANHAYVWGLAEAGDYLWFGTMSNTHCLIIGNLFGSGVETSSYVCEGANSTYNPTLAAAGLGDWRPPRIFRYNKSTKQTDDRTNTVGPALELVNFTLGLRYASALDDVVMLGGPNLPGTAINLFAFKASDGSFLGAKALPAYNDIRKAVVHDGVLYIGVQNTAGGGSVLRWTGSVASPFQFAVVGNLDLNAAYIALHDGRLFVTTWPVLPSPTDITPVFTGLMNLWMSPTIPAGGLTAADASNWTKVWQVDQYEPDPLVKNFYLGGDLYSFGGHLYWGTMHVPFIPTMAAMQALDIDPGNDGVDTTDLLTTALGTHRAIAVFRGKNFGTATQTIELLYGNRYLPVYDPVQESYTIAQDPMHMNKMGAIPKWGPSGIDNFFNTYTWAMMGYKDMLYLGTFDWSYFLTENLVDLLLPLAQEPQNPAVSITDVIAVLMRTANPGADLFYFPSARSRARVESRTGVGNRTSYGIRNMLVAGDSLFLGMANPMNLLTDTTDNRPEGGWELIELKGSASPPPPPGPKPNPGPRPRPW